MITMRDRYMAAIDDFAQALRDGYFEDDGLDDFGDVLYPPDQGVGPCSFENLAFLVAARDKYHACSVFVDAIYGYGAWDWIENRRALCERADELRKEGGAA